LGHFVIRFEKSDNTIIAFKNKGLELKKGLKTGLLSVFYIPLLKKIVFFL